MIFDPMYWILLAPAMLLAAWASISVKTAYAKASKIPVRSGMTGAQAAQRILASNGLDHVRIEPVRGHLSDHYDPRHQVLRLSSEVYNGRSLASVGIAAHEAGHAIQHGVGYAPLKLRNAIVPTAGFGSNMSFILIFVGLLLNSLNLMIVGIVLFSAVVVFQLVNLPVELNASRRARAVLMSHGIVTEAEDPLVGKVLNAAAMTYVAATLTAIMTLLYWVLVVMGGRR